MMKRSVGLGIAMVGMLAMGCGGGTVTVRVPRAPVLTAAPECASQWVHMPMLITFPTSGQDLDYQNRAILEQLVQSAQARNDIRRVRVEGHTDTCGNELNNMALSSNRAVSVANELVMMGVPREMVDTIGYGSTQPRANENCAGGSRGRSQALSEQTNRRVEFSLYVCR